MQQNVDPEVLNRFAIIPKHNRRGIILRCMEKPPNNICGRLSVCARNCRETERVVRGVQPGPLPGKSGRRGIYSFEAVAETRALASTQYAVYSDLGQDLVTAPRLLLAVDGDQAGYPRWAASAQVQDNGLCRPAIRGLSVFICMSSRKRTLSVWKVLLSGTLGLPNASLRRRGGKLPACGPMSLSLNLRAINAVANATVV